MLVLLILAVTVGLGFASGYGLRDLISRRRRRRGGMWSRAASKPQTTPAGDLAINLDGLLVAANGHAAGPRPRQQHQRGDERSEQPDDFDGAVRDLLSELNRRSSQPQRPARRVRR